MPSVRYIFLIVSGLILVCPAAPVRADLNKHKNKPGIVYWHGDPLQNKIALTFDDGPNEPYTSQILKVLHENGVKATFFLVGKNVETFPDSVKAEVAAGHVIGNHTYTHPDLIFRTKSRIVGQLEKTEAAIYKAVGLSTYLFRPPFGADDPFTFHESRRLGYIAVKWSVSSRDWERPGVDKIVKNVVIRVRNGSIILMHDGMGYRRGDRSQTVKALPIIIRELKKRGFEFVTVPELLNLN